MTPSASERARLEMLRQERIADAAAIATSLADVRAARSDGTADDEHDPEGSTLTADWSHLEGLSAAARAHLAEIDVAIARLDAGTYGTCARCGQAIAPARLEARPATPLCIACATRLGR